MKKLITHSDDFSIFLKSIVRVTAGLIILASFHTFAIAGGGNKSFTIFNAIHYKNTPDLSSMGLQPINLIYEYFLLTPTNRLPDYDSIRKVASKCFNNPDLPVTLDIESWSFDAQNIDATIKYYLQTIDTFKKTNNKSPLGFYGVVPANIIYKWKKIKTDVNEFNNWKQLNAQLQPIADHVDIFFPAFYTYNKDTTAWKEAITATIKEVKKYSKDKPVYGYIWPQFHVSTPLKFQFLEPEMWNFQLETLYNLTDGVVIWTSNKDVNGNIINWDTTMPWWKVTQDFIQRHELIDQNNGKYLNAPINQETGFENYSVYPNPAKDELKISWKNDLVSQLPVSIALYSMNGQKLMDTQVPFNEGNAQLSLKEIPSGLYSCVLYSGDKKFVSRVTVIK